MTVDKFVAENQFARDTLTTELAVQQVHEKAGANGFETLAVGYFPAPSAGSDGDDAPAFFPRDAAISIRLELDWTHFAGEKPAAAYYGVVYRVTLEAVSVPTEPIRDEYTLQVVGEKIADRGPSGGLQRPIGKRL